MSNQQLWQAILGNLEISLSKAYFNTWLKNTAIVERGEDSITIGVPSTYHKDWIASKYQAEILKSLKGIAPEIKTIHYQLGISTKSTHASSGSATATATKPDSTATVSYKESVGVPASGLNPKYIFETFIAGKNSDLAHAASIAVSKNPGNQYNPLFIYGGVGLGKTHLMQAVGNRMLESNPRANILYVTSEKFTNDYVQAIQNKRMDAFKKHYRSADMLLIDDIQFISSKEQTQEEFFHTFNELRDKGKQIIITSDRLPKDIPSIEQRLVSRFEWGMIADIQAPDLETRLAILNTKVAKKSVTIDDKILYYIAENIQNNVRELEGALNKLIVYQQMNNRELSVDEARQLLANMVTSKKKSTSIKKIATLVAEFYHITLDDLLKQSRRKEYVKPRQVAMFIVRQELETSFPIIGEFFGGRDHTTVMHAVEKMTKQVQDSENFKQEIDLILDKLYV